MSVFGNLAEGKDFGRSTLSLNYAVSLGDIGYSDGREHSGGAADAISSFSLTGGVYVKVPQPTNNDSVRK